MTDRYNALIVALESDIREDDAQLLISAIMQLRGVASVTGNTVNTSDYVAQSRARNEMMNRLLDGLK